MYNGWSNRKTWLMVLYHLEDCNKIARDEGHKKSDDPYDLAETLENEILNRLTIPEPESWEADIFWNAFNRVDWVEIAKATLADLDE